MNKIKPTIPTWLQMLISFFVLLFIVLKCESCNREEEEEEPKVTWSNYDKEVKIRIDSLVQSENCMALQNEFNSAEDNSKSQRNRIGEGNASLMNYIDFKMKKIKCN